MPAVLLIVGLIVGVLAVYAAMGRGGELSAEHADFAPLDLGPVSAADVALLRPPSAAWGYDMQVTDEALERIADSIRERDVRIVALEQLVTDLSRDAGPVARKPWAQGPFDTRSERPGRSETSETSDPPDTKSQPQARVRESSRQQPPPERSHG